MMLVLILGLYMSLMVKVNGLDNRVPYSNAFFYVFLKFEPPVFILMLFFSFLLKSYLFSKNLLHFEPFTLGAFFQGKTAWIWFVAASVLLTTWLGSTFILHNFPLSNDEFITRLQARIFATASVFALVEPPWKEFANALTAINLLFDPVQSTWTSGTLPVHAALHTSFLVLGLESITGPLFGALSIILLAFLSRKVWPREAFAPFVAVALLASSPQFLINSMTTYAMPAHLAFNLAWLHFYLRNDRLGNTLTPWVGFLAMGLHNPFVHALFVAPFLFTLCRQQKWARIIYFAFVYSGGAIVWLLWWKATRPTMGAAEYLRIFGLPGLYQILIQPMNLSLFFSWQSLSMLIMAILTLTQWSSLTPFFRNLAFGCFLTFGFYVFFPVDQFLGWGYRFTYGVLGNFVLLATAGWFHLRGFFGFKKAWGFLTLGIFFSLAVQFPLRCMQAESFVRPFFKSTQYIQSLPQNFVIIDPRKIWLGEILVRNDPFLQNNPKVFFRQLLTEEQEVKLHKLGEVRSLTSEELVGYGLFQISP